MLYKDEKDLIYEADIKHRKNTDDIEIVFYSDCGKFGAEEMLAAFKLTPKRLLSVLNDRQDLTDDEII